MKSQSESYKAAGVDITAGYQAVELMKKHIARTVTAGVATSRYRRFWRSVLKWI